MKFLTESRRLGAWIAVALVLTASTACFSSGKKIRAMKLSASHVAIANKLFQQQRMQEALGQANQALQLWGKNPYAYLMRGQIYFGIREYERAIVDFTSANDLRDPFGDALNWRGWTRTEIGDMEGAEEDWNLALQDTRFLTPEKIYFNLALLYRKQGKSPQSLKNLEKAVIVNPAYARGHFELGKMREESGDSSRAIISYEAALGGMRNSADLNLRLALVLESNGEGARAREHFKRVIALSPDSPEASKAAAHLKNLDSASL
jgi:tetratricopeptide (TPR) repeat protein